MSLYEIAVKLPGYFNSQFAMNPNESVIPFIRNRMITLDQTLSICGNSVHPLNSVQTRESIIAFQIGLREFGVNLFPNIVFNGMELIGPVTINGLIQSILDLGDHLGRLHMLSLWAIRFSGADPNFDFVVLDQLVNRIENWIENTPGLASLQPILNSSQTQINHHIDAFNQMLVPNGH